MKAKAAQGPGTGRTRTGPLHGPWVVRSGSGVQGARARQPPTARVRAAECSPPRAGPVQRAGVSTAGSIDQHQAPRGLRGSKGPQGPAHPKDGELKLQAGTRAPCVKRVGEAWWERVAG